MRIYTFFNSQLVCNNISMHIQTQCSICLKSPLKHDEGKHCSLFPSGVDCFIRAQIKS